MNTYGILATLCGTCYPTIITSSTEVGHHFPDTKFAAFHPGLWDLCRHSGRRLSRMLHWEALEREPGQRRSRERQGCEGWSGDEAKGVMTGQANTSWTAWDARQASRARG